MGKPSFGQDVRNVDFVSSDDLLLLLNPDLYWDAERLTVGGLPPLARAFVPKVEGVEVLVSVDHGSWGAAVLNLQGGHARLDELAARLLKLGWSEASKSTWRAGDVGGQTACYCGGVGRACISKGRQVHAGLRVLVRFYRSDDGCAEPATKFQPFSGDGGPLEAFTRNLFDRFRSGGGQYGQNYLDWNWSMESHLPALRLLEDLSLDLENSGWTVGAPQAALGVASVAVSVSEESGRRWIGQLMVRTDPRLRSRKHGHLQVSRGEK